MSKYYTARFQPVGLEINKLLANTVPTDSGCLLWQGAVNSDGYPKLGRRRKDTGNMDANVKGHRHIYELVMGVTLPSDVVVRHSCDNPLCINPDHLSKGSPMDNINDRRSRSRSYHHIDEALVLRAKDAIKLHSSYTAAAKHLSISVAQLAYIRKKYLKINE